MNSDQAKILLSFHSQRNESIEDPRWENSFLGSLRPYQGKLIESHFHEVMSCIQTLSSELTNNFIEKEVVSDIIGIIHFARAWGIHEDGMLKRNNLISESDSTKLETWIEIISYTFIMILDDSEEAFNEYETYKEENGQA